MSDNSNVAALGAAVIAIAVSMNGIAGPYGWDNIAISITLLIMIIAFGFPNEKTNVTEKLAIASIIGMAVLPAMGGVYDLMQQVGCGKSEHDKCVHDTCFTPFGHFISWLLVSLIVTCAQFMREKLLNKIS